MISHLSEDEKWFHYSANHLWAIFSGVGKQGYPQGHLSESGLFPVFPIESAVFQASHNIPTPLSPSLILLLPIATWLHVVQLCIWLLNV